MSQERNMGSRPKRRNLDLKGTGFSPSVLASKIKRALAPEGALSMPAIPQPISVSKTPVRGTQSFVGIMAQVWGCPSLTGLEIVWRWLAGVLLIFIARQAFGGFGVEIGLDPTPLQSVTVFRPVEAIQTLRTVIDPVWNYALPTLHWLLPIVFFLWNLIAALGRTLTLRRLDPTLHARRFTLFLLGTLRSALLLSVWFLYFRYVAFSARYSILTPAANNQEPNVVLFAAMIICGTLLLYVLWGTFSWFLQLAPLLAMRNNLGAIAALRASIIAGPVRGKLIEINLVMNIVRIALIVLAMVFSASPLPFTTVATQQFLTCWWIGVILLYLAANDYFHVVRAASYLSLYRVYNPPPAN